MTTTPGGLLAGMLAAGLLAACGSASSDGTRAGAQQGGDEPITPRALAAVVAEHTGEPSSAQRSTDLDEVGKGLVAGVELRYPGDDEQSDGDLLTVGVGTGFERVASSCAALRDQGLSGCERTDDGLVFWEQESPEEDPGVVYVLVSKGETDVLLWSSGPPITGDPRQLDLPISVADMLAVAADARVDVTTSRAAIEAGRDLASWSDSRT